MAHRFHPDRRRALGTMAAAAAASAGFAPLAHAAWPERNLRLILPYAAGASGDMLTRELGDGLQAELAVPVITENRPGGGTVVGANFVAKQPADGYTVLMMGPATHVIMPIIQPAIPYEVYKDFDIVGMWAIVGSMVSVNPALPVQTIAELVAYSKANPGKLSYSSAGTGTGPHLSGEMFKQMTGADLTHVPYNGAAPATLALLSGEVQVSFINIPPQVPHVRTGKIRALATTTSARSPLLPEVPTSAEVGLKGYIAESWYGLAVPRGTPAEARARLEKAMFKVGGQRDRRARMAAGGADVKLLDAKDALAYVQGEESRLRPIIQKLGLKA